MMGIYNAQYADYQIKAAFTDLTEEERIVLREKKKLLADLYPAIRIYDTFVAAPGGPAPADEQAIIALINQIERLVVRRISQP